MDKITVVVATVDPARMSSAEIRHISSYTNDKMPKKKKHTMFLPFSVVSGSAIVLINGDSDQFFRETFMVVVISYLGLPVKPRLLTSQLSTFDNIIELIFTLN